MYFAIDNIQNKLNNFVSTHWKRPSLWFRLHVTRVYQYYKTTIFIDIILFTVPFIGEFGLL